MQLLRLLMISRDYTGFAGLAWIFDVTLEIDEVHGRHCLTFYELFTESNHPSQNFVEGGDSFSRIISKACLVIISIVAIKLFLILLEML